jgi:hypothetical protein
VDAAWPATVQEVIALPDIQLLSPLASKGHRLESRWIHIESVDTSSRYLPSLSGDSCWRRRSVRKGQGIPVAGYGECCADQSLGQSWSRHIEELRCTVRTSVSQSYETAPCPQADQLTEHPLPIPDSGATSAIVGLRGPIQINHQSLELGPGSFTRAAHASQGSVGRAM